MQFKRSFCHLNKTRACKHVNLDICPIQLSILYFASCHQSNIGCSKNNLTLTTQIICYLYIEFLALHQNTSNCTEHAEGNWQPQCRNLLISGQNFGDYFNYSHKPSLGQILYHSTASHKKLFSQYNVPYVMKDKLANVCRVLRL